MDRLKTAGCAVPYLLEVEVFFRWQQLELFSLLLWSSQQQVVKHVIVPVKSNTPHSSRLYYTPSYYCNNTFFKLLFKKDESGIHDLFASLPGEQLSVNMSFVFMVTNKIFGDQKSTHYKKQIERRQCLEFSTRAISGQVGRQQSFVVSTRSLTNNDIIR